MDAAERKFESLVEKRAADGIVFVEFADGEDAIAGNVIDSFDQGVTAQNLARYEKEYADKPEELEKLKQKYNWNFRR